MSRDVTNVLHAYGAAWNEPDPAARLALLEASWADGGCYLDPTAKAEGRATLSDHIGGFHASMPGARLELTSGASAHHGRIFFSWRLVTGTGEVVVEGVDFGRLADDGRIAEIVGFFGSPPAA